MAFRWQDTIHISDKFSPQEQAHIAHALDQIVQTGSEGIALLEKASDLHGGHIDIVKAAPGSIHPASANDKVIEGGGADTTSDTRGTIFLIPNEENMYRDTDAEWKPVSYAGLLVHEFYHEADPRIAGAKGKEYILKLLMAILPKEEMAHANALVKEGKTDEFIAYISQQGEKTPEFAEAVTAAAQAIGMSDSKGNPFDEHDAVRFTDEFMRKYFVGEPWRGDYKNGALWHSTPPPDATPRDPNACFQPAVGGFEARIYDGKVAPTVAPQAERNNFQIELFGKKIDIGCWRAINGGEHPTDTAPLKIPSVPQINDGSVITH